MVPPATNSPSCSGPDDVVRDGLALIHGTDVSRSFSGRPTVTAVNGLSFEIQEGKITAIVGESGSGKSTLLRLIYGLLEPDGGEVRYRGAKVPNPREKLIPGHDAMRMVSQGFDDLNTYANVWDNVASQLSNTDLEVKYRETERVLGRLRIAPLAEQRVADLSGGEKQRVAISRALINKPEVLLMDEPFNQIDASFRERLQQDIRAIVAETGLTVVLVSHDPTEVLSMADELLVLKDGRLVAAASPQTLYQAPPDTYTARLLARSNILTKEQALELGIATNAIAAVHPEWLSLRENPASPFEILDIRFKGFYEEVTVGNGRMALHVIHQNIGAYCVGVKVTIQVDRFHVFA